MHSLRNLWGATVLIPLTALVLPPVQAQDLVKDGNFEQADSVNGPFTVGQSIGDGAFTVAFGSVNIDATTNGNGKFVFAGNQALFLSNDSNVDGVHQTLATTPGQTYTLSFVANSDDPSNFFEVLFGNQVPTGSPFSITANGFPSTADNGNASLFTTYSLSVTAASSSTVLTILGQSTGTTEVDNVSVVAAPAVPEASTTVSLGLLLALGMGGMVVAARRKTLR